MEEQWIREIQERLENHEEAVPEGVWDEIEKVLFQEKEALILNFEIKPKTCNPKNYPYKMQLVLNYLHKWKAFMRRNWELIHSS